MENSSNIIATSDDGTNGLSIASCYFLEVIKNGISLPEATINLSDIDHCILGRQPGPLLNPQNPTGRTSTLLHPSISRAHAVLQFGSDSDLAPGWYVYDLNSTHGTFVNKHRLPSGRYIRLRVGYVLRFGSSTRLLILNGPESDVESETEETWSELVARKKSKSTKGKQEKKELNEESNANACNWGMVDDVDEAEDVLHQRLAESGNCLSHENSYIADPKRALRAFFDREGTVPLPEYEFVEGRFGQQICRIELPLEAGTLYAEVPMTGQKRKEAIVACALEACRILDRLGEFEANKEGAEAVRRAREKAYWQSNDYYSSDEDTFLDRTGQIEARRSRRMRRMGVEGAEVTQIVDSTSQETSKGPQDSLSLLAALEELGKKIIEVETELNAAERAMEAVGENATEMDELEAYMEAIKRGAPKRAERQKLKRRLVALRQEETRLLRRVGIRGGGSSTARFSSSASSAAATAVRAAASQRSGADGSRRSHQIGERVLQRRKIEEETKDEEEFVPEVEEEDEEEDDTKTNVDAKQEYPEANLAPVEKMGKGEALKRPSSPTSQSSSPKRKVRRSVEEDSSAPSADELHSVAPSLLRQESPRAVEEMEVERPLIGPQRLPDSVADKVMQDEQSLVVPAENSSDLSPSAENDLDEAYDYNMNDPNFALWMPPKGPRKSNADSSRVILKVSLINPGVGEFNGEIVDPRGDPSCNGIVQPFDIGQIVAKAESGEVGRKYLFEVDLSTITNSDACSNESLEAFDAMPFEALPVAPPPSTPVITPVPRKNETEQKNECELGKVPADWSSPCPNSTLGVFQLDNGEYILSMLIHQGITDITILVKFQFLRFVILSHNHISDISPIFAAEYLTYLKADHNRIVKAGNEKSLQYLQFYDLSHNKLTCTDYINHGRLKHLILSYNEIATLKGVEGPPLNQFKLRSLETLELRGNKITSSEGLSELHDLKTLYFSENLLRSVEDISPMKELARLHLRDNNIRRLDGFLQDNPIADRDHYRPIVLGILPRLQRLDKDKTSPTEIADAVAFYEKLDAHFMEEDEEEAEEEGKAAELMAEAKLDELIEEGGMGKYTAEVIVEEGGNEEMDNEVWQTDRAVGVLLLIALKIGCLFF
ncbi:unnamed protein product [Taenia asiatica]|uniref:FHA domain-containing protein n=1 Tax=Taenia asiatica TaxID=60517 RepID=A0A0R3W6B0_TAEAS|nr:unnamed protein product [Taenia asiatica]